MKTAICQLLIEGGEPYRNFERAEEMLSQAKEEASELALFPETIDFAWTHPSGLKEADFIPGVFSDLLCDLAKKQKIFICAGLTEKTKEGNYNTALLIDSKGEIIHKYRKINLLEVEFPYYVVGRSLSVASSPWGQLGINICSDNYKSSLEIGNALFRMGAQCLLSPSSWTVDHSVTEQDSIYENKWKEPFSFLAKTFQIPVLSATGVGYIVGGPYEGKKMIGGSLAAFPDGTFKEGVYNELSKSLFCLDVPLTEIKYKGVQVGQRIQELRSKKKENTDGRADRT